MEKVEQGQWLQQLKNLDHPTPFKVMDTSIAVDRVKKLKQLMPRVEVFYAVKSCSNRELIEAIDSYVAGYDIASRGEFDYLTGLGVGPERLLYSNPVKIPSHIRETYEAGARFYAFDSTDEIKKLADDAPDSQTYLRVKVSDYGSIFPLSSKFGVDPINVVAYVDTAEDHGLNVTGLSFHVGSQSDNPQSWETAFETCGDLIRRLENNGTKITMLNIGGGFPADYTEKIPAIEKIAETINKSIEKHIPADVRIVAEPGRYVSAETSVIVASVIGREHRGSSNWLFTDMGVFQGLIEPLEMPELRYPIFTDYSASASKVPMTVTGPTCDAYDTLGFDYELPKALQIGDRIYIGTTGAYTDVYESKFNGFEPPKTYYINNIK